MNQSIIEAIERAIAEALEGAVVEVEAGAGPGHYNVTVKSAHFAGKPMVEAHRLVYSAIAPLMDGDSAPVHAIDRLKTLA